MSNLFLEFKKVLNGCLDTSTNEYERAAKIFLQGCSCSAVGKPEECKYCLTDFINRIKELAREEKYLGQDINAMDFDRKFFVKENKNDIVKFTYGVKVDTTRF